MQIAFNYNLQNRVKMYVSLASIMLCTRETQQFDSPNVHFDIGRSQATHSENYIFTNYA